MILRVVSYNEWVLEPEILEKNKFGSLPVYFFSTQCSFLYIILFQTHNIVKKQKHKQLETTPFKSEAQTVFHLFPTLTHLPWILGFSNWFLGFLN